MRLCTCWLCDVTIPLTIIFMNKSQSLCSWFKLFSKTNLLGTAVVVMNWLWHLTSIIKPNPWYNFLKMTHSCYMTIFYIQLGSKMFVLDSHDIFTISRSKGTGNWSDSNCHCKKSFLIYASKVNLRMGTAHIVTFLSGEWLFSAPTDGFLKIVRYNVDIIGF